MSCDQSMEEGVSEDRELARPLPKRARKELPATSIATNKLKRRLVSDAVDDESRKPEQSEAAPPAKKRRQRLPPPRRAAIQQYKEKAAAMTLDKLTQYVASVADQFARHELQDGALILAALDRELSKRIMPASLLAPPATASIPQPKLDDPEYQYFAHLEVLLPDGTPLEEAARQERIESRGISDVFHSTGLDEMLKEISRATPHDSTSS